MQLKIGQVGLALALQRIRFSRPEAFSGRVLALEQQCGCLDVARRSTSSCDTYTMGGARRTGIRPVFA